MAEKTAEKLEIDVVADVKDVKQKVDDLTAKVDEMGKKAESSADGGSKALEALGKAGAAVGKAVVAAGAAAGTATLGIGTAALSSYASYEQLVGGVDKLFGDASGKLQAYAADAYRTSGMSANQYMEQATSFSASMVKSLGGDTAKAADMTDLAMRSMSDNVNVFGSSMTDVQNAYQGFAKQNYTMLDNLKLGYGGTQEEMKRLISDANKLPAVMKEGNDLSIDSYADVVEAIARVQEAQGIAGTTAKEAMGTIEGSIAMTKAAWDNWLTGLANPDADMSALTDQLLTGLGAVAENVAPRVVQIGEAILTELPKALSGAASVLTPVVSSAVAAAWNSGAQLLSTLGISLPPVDASQVLAAYQAVSDYLTGTLLPAFAPVGEAVSGLAEQLGPLMLPLVEQLGTTLSGLAPIVSAVAAAAVGLATTVMATVMPIATQILGWVNANMPVIQSTVTGVMGAIGSVVQIVMAALSGDWSGVWEGIKAVAIAVWNGIISVVSAAIGAVMSVVSAVLSAISGVWGSIWGAISGVASAVWGDIRSAVGSAINAVSSVISSVLSAIQGTWDSVWGSISGFFSGIWDGLRSAASGGIDAVYSTVTGIKDKILGFFSGAGEWLVDSGKAILGGLKDGIMNGFNAARGAVEDGLSTLRSFFPFSPAKRGPFSGHGYTTFSGKALMGDFARSIAAQRDDVMAAAESVLDPLQAAMSPSLSATYDFAPAPAAPAQVSQVINFNSPVQTPDQMARESRMWAMYGLGATA
ncbi:hypothetical protein [uncultured Parolsenella sp.]|uniref:phage tail protein n=1 Tax=uncultured Parolsenella sp. TaxID=2083008 RepID=UPI0027D9A519|nr:hypothetical protein [uncultured Parolsenella sp.]